MLFKRFLIWGSGSPPDSSCLVEQNHLCNFERRHHREYSCEVIWNLDQWFKRRCRLKTLYQELWQPLCSADRNHFCYLGRSYYEEQFCEIIMNLDQWFRRKCCLEVFLIWKSVSPFVQRSVTICVIMVEGIMRNNSMKSF